MQRCVHRAHTRAALPRLRLALLAALLAIASQSVGWAVDRQRAYLVRPGDTLSGISLMTGIPITLLISLNRIVDPNRILAGQSLRLSDDDQQASGGGSSGANGRPTYVVKAGDSLSRIAAERGLTLAALLELNRLDDPNRIQVGQRLTLPARSEQPPVAALQATPGAPSAVSNSALPGTGVGALLDAAAGRYGIDAALVKALAWHLSAWRSDARSAEGAVGVMQITRATQDWVAERLLQRAVDREDPSQNVEIGVAYLAYLIQRFGHERQGVAAYLQGPASVTRQGLSRATERVVETIWSGRGRLAATAQPVEPATRPNAAVADLRSEVIAAFRQVAGEARLGVAARNLASGERIGIRADEVFPSASVNKLPIAIETYRQAEAGLLVMTPVISDDLELSLVQSDNDAANHLLDVVGEARVNATMAALGLSGTVLSNHFSATRGPAEAGFNQTTPADSAALLSLLASSKLVSTAASEAIRNAMLRSADGTKLAAGLPAGVALAHKSGWYAAVANDVGIVYAPRATYILAVFTDGTSDPETADQAIVAISRVVFGAWGR